MRTVGYCFDNDCVMIPIDLLFKFIFTVALLPTVALIVTSPAELDQPNWTNMTTML